jgi:serine protease Do
MRTPLLIAVLFLAITIGSAAEQKAKDLPRSSNRPGWLGVSIQDVTPKFAREQELKIKEGAYVNDVVDDSPADSAGLNEGDVIVDFNGTKIEAAEDLTAAVRDTKPGTKVTVKVNRNGEIKSLTATIRKNNNRFPFAVAAPRAPRIMLNMFGGDVEGMDLMDLNKQLAEYFDVPGGKGVLVKSVEKGESAAQAGIKAGDVITRIGTETITDVEDIRDAITDNEEGDKVPVELLRKGKKVTVTIEVSEQDNDSEGELWRHPGHENFNFQFAPQLDEFENGLRMKLRELPKRHKEVQRRETEASRKGV